MAQVRRAKREQPDRGRWLEQEELPRLVRGLVELGAERIILFGSRARGQAHAESDLDLMVVMPSKQGRLERLLEVCRRLDVPSEVELKVYTPEEFAAGSPFIWRAVAESQTLYEKPGLPPLDREEAAMRYDPQEEGEVWLNSAQQSLEDARFNTQGQRFRLACFLCHQTVEKAFKAFLNARGRPRIRSHQVKDLCLRSSRLDSTFAEVQPVLENYDRYYMETRYPDAALEQPEPIEFNEETAQRALRTAERVLELVRERIVPASEESHEGTGA